jgi:prephenate dehydratase
VIPAGSTAGAAAALVEEPPAYEAAIAPRLAAEVYALEVLADDIGDNDEASTRFVLVSLPGALPARTGADKTTLTLFMREDHPGALLEILTEFAVRGVNLTRIESRPTRKALGDYYFSVDCEGHIDDARVGEALAGLHRICAHVRFLGSYPRHDGRAPLLRPGVTDADFAAADSWLTSVRHRP